ncbi:MAG TPA: hypothetical protein VKS81_04160 [Bacteroidota bacterium]|nr:hypothetical protein [Bacteroidota bacterium]
MDKSLSTYAIAEAKRLLSLLKESSDQEYAKLADDILIFFHRLHDHFGIAKSSSPRFSGRTFIILEDIIYELESHPEETMQSASSHEFIVHVLEDIATGKLTIIAKQA